MTIPALILAAGGSRRLGQPKQLLCVDGEPLLPRVIRIVRSAGAQPVVVVLGGSLAPIQTGVDFSDCEVVVNEHWDRGIASSIHAGLAAVESQSAECDGVLLLACDQPRLTVGHVEKMLRVFAEHNGRSMIASSYAETRGIPAIFPRSLFPGLLKLEGDRGARSLLFDPRQSVIEVPLEGGEIDIDTPADLRYLD